MSKLLDGVAQPNGKVHRDAFLAKLTVTPSTKSRHAPGRRSPPSVSSSHSKREEIEVGGQLFRFADMDGDGVMDMNEAMMDGMSERQFKMVDADGDGHITRAEFNAFVTRMAADTPAPKTVIRKKARGGMSRPGLT